MILFLSLLAASAGPSPAAELPLDHDLRLGADLSLISRFVPLRAALEEALAAPRSQALRRGMKRLGIDPLNDLKTLAIGWKVRGPSTAHSVALIGGAFSRRRVESGLRQLKPGTLIERKHRQYTLWVEGRSGQMLSIKADGKALIGSPASVRAGLYSARRPRRRPSFLRGAPVWFDGPVTPALRAVLGDTDPGSPLALVRHVRARLDLVDRQLRLKVRLACANSVDANGLAMTLNLAATGLAFQHPKWSVVLAKVGVMPKGATVVLSASIDRATLAKIRALSAPARPARRPAKGAR
jgi:hypothetical protein